MLLIFMLIEGSNCCAESFYAIENLSTPADPRRGTTTDAGIPDGTLILAPNTKYRLWRYEPDSELIGTIEFTTPQAARRFRIPTPEFRLKQTRDRDDDGLSDEAEWIIGTQPGEPDSDMDGTEDGAEVAAGTNPLDGLAIQTGIILSRETDGLAKDVATFNNLVVVADGDEGISVFNVFNTMEATIIAQVMIPGDALSVAYPGGRMVAVAGGSGGVSVVDLADGPGARVVARIGADSISGGGEVRAVTASANLGIGGTNDGRIFTFDLVTGVVYDIENIGGGDVHDLAVRGGLIFVLSDDKRLRIYPLSELIGGRISQTTLSNFAAETLTGRSRLHVGKDYAYASRFPGFDVVDIRDPAAPVVQGSAVNAGLRSFKQIRPDGQGVGVSVEGADPGVPEDQQNVALYDISDPAVTTAFTGAFPTPGRARAVALYNGLAYIADGEAGLQVINYRAVDTAGVAPTGQLLASVAGNEAVEGSVINVLADVQDDVMVRNVEFFANGQRIGTDGSFPYEVGLRIPQIESGGNVEITAVVRDTGANVFRPAALNLRITADTEPPTVDVNTNLSSQIITDRNPIEVDLDIADNVNLSLDSGAVSFEIQAVDGAGQPTGTPVVLAAQRSGADLWSIESPGVGAYQLRIRVTDGSGNVTWTDPIEFRVRHEVISREMSVLNFGPDPSAPKEAISRETSVLNSGPDAVQSRQAISREVSVENEAE